MTATARRPFPKYAGTFLIPANGSSFKHSHSMVNCLFDLTISNLKRAGENCLLTLTLGTLSHLL